MKKIITAIGNPKLNEELKKENNFEIIGKDLQYKEAILEILEKNKKIDLIIISENLLGNISFENLFEKINLLNNKIKIIFILEQENSELKNILIKNNINYIYYKNKINLIELIKLINKKEILNSEKINQEKNNNKSENKFHRVEIKNKKIKNKIKKEKNKQLKKTNWAKDKKSIQKNFFKEKILTIKNILKQNRKLKTVDREHFMLNKIITFSGNAKSGKTTLALIISQYLSNKNYRVLLVDGDFEKHDLSIILKRELKIQNERKNFLGENCEKFERKNFNFQKGKINKEKIDKEAKNEEIINNKINLLTKKINNNFYFFSELNQITQNCQPKIQKMKIDIFLQLLKDKYDFIIFDLSKYNFGSVNEEIITNASKNFLVTDSNVLGIKELRGTIRRYVQKFKIKETSLHIIENRYSSGYINKDLALKILSTKSEIFVIREDKKYSFFIENFFKRNILLKNKKIKKDLNKIILKIKN